jgi:signal peptidase I
MSPTLEPNDFFVVDPWRYRHIAPAVGDVVVFGRPGNPAVRYVKRIVGLPGDVVEIRGGVVYRNDAPLHESDLHAPTDRSWYGRDLPPVRLADDEYYVLGDIRDNSQDSRNFGAVARSAFVGPVVFVWHSPGHGNVPPGRYPRSVGSASVH